MFSGEYNEALVNYERASSQNESDDHNIRCKEGICRTCLRLGDLRRGMAITSEPSASITLKYQAAIILESVKVFSKNKC